MEISVPVTEPCQLNAWLQQDIAAEQSAARLPRNTLNFFFIHAGQLSVNLLQP